MILLARLSAPTRHAFGVDNACQQQSLPVLFLRRVILTERYWVILAKRRSVNVITSVDVQTSSHADEQAREQPPPARL